MTLTLAPAVAVRRFWVRGRFRLMISRTSRPPFAVVDLFEGALTCRRAAALAAQVPGADGHKGFAPG